MLKPVFKNRFRKSLRLCERRGYDMSLFEVVLTLLITGQPLPKKYKPHKLGGDLSNHWDCHIKDDWVLLYRYDYTNGNIVLEDTGTHADLF